MTPPLPRDARCETCDGSGWLDAEGGEFGHEIACPACNPARDTTPEDALEDAAREEMKDGRG